VITGSDHLESPEHSALDPVERALGDALTAATLARQWDTVKVLVAELEARRRARSGVVDLSSERAKRGKGRV
jgi:hypothetical protein